MMCLHNYKSLSLFNGQTFNIVSFGETSAKLKRQSDGTEVEVKYTILYKVKCFDMSFYCTVNKIQGSTIRDHYNIHQLDNYRMDLNNIYTAMSRGIALSMVHFNYDEDRVFKRETPPTGSVLRKLSNESIIGRLYYLSVTGSDERYYGCTENELDNRLQEHIDNPTSAKMREFLESGTPSITLVREFRILHTSTLLAEEAALIRSAILSGIKLRNTMHNTESATVQPKIEQQKVYVHKEIKIMDDVKGKSFRIRRMVAGKLQDERFSYAKQSKDDARKLAEDRVAVLTSNIKTTAGYIALTENAGTSGTIISL